LLEVLAIAGSFGLQSCWKFWLPLQASPVDFFVNSILELSQKFWRSAPEVPA
jgi:hypothetical protein